MSLGSSLERKKKVLLGKAPISAIFIFPTELGDWEEKGSKGGKEELGNGRKVWRHVLRQHLQRCWGMAVKRPGATSVWALPPDPFLVFWLGTKTWSFFIVIHFSAVLCFLFPKFPIKSSFVKVLPSLLISSHLTQTWSYIYSKTRQWVSVDGLAWNEDEGAFKGRPLEDTLE